FIRGAVFCFLAIVAEKMDSRVAHASWFRGGGGVDSCAVAAVQYRSVDCRCACGRPQLAISSAKRGALGSDLGRRYRGVRRLSHWWLGWRQICLGTSWFPLRQRALSLLFHN